MNYEEFKVAWVDKEANDYICRRGMPYKTQAVIDLCNRVFDWTFPVEMKDVYEANLANGSLQKRCDL